MGFIVAALVVVAGSFSRLISLGAADAPEPVLTQTPSDEPEETPVEEPASVLIEGEGRNTAEAVARDYLGALQALDWSALVQLYAVESFVASCDGALHMETMGIYMQGGPGCPMPDEAGEVGRSINLELRHRDVLSNAGTVIEALGAPSLLNDFRGVMLQDEASVAEFQDTLAQEVVALEGGFTSIERVDVAEFLGEDELERVRFGLDTIAGWLGVGSDDVDFVFMTFEFRGQTNIFAPVVVRYDDRWYIHSTQSAVSLLIGVPNPGIGVPD